MEKCIYFNGVNSPVGHEQGSIEVDNFENVIPDFESIIEPFTVNHSFAKFESFSLATLQLFKTMGDPMYNIKNWSSGTLKRWNDTFREYCQGYFTNIARIYFRHKKVLVGQNFRHSPIITIENNGLEFFTRPKF